MRHPAAEVGEAAGGEHRADHHGGPVEREDAQRAPRAVAGDRQIGPAARLAPERQRQQEGAQDEEEADAGVAGAHEGLPGQYHL